MNSEKIRKNLKIQEQTSIINFINKIKISDHREIQNDCSEARF